ncbi:b(0,+)-type amino acid transporter 1-like [Actinia tenebrosa]|uniref:b(0,+)-type amino acid transporter 1 n=1 Tax=Actinia tenebrosa TaxID=6105 RepID=A0A6P8IPA9_ACTTE|nr:b(0,+)-type amino acid transporter 1-like [Actinia tenebrosa]XP_031568722.1 b(0,+)-type amino acid transporter 1-like [Actinia tenebrosa]XP_031568723.1 b(0,+)-type amino acid transporter 1-like [Actinia tenebrosa]XP_031568724.1 b(0,+)-type amino acid transporter 1-like [Actinia tenebrosa]XP_031568725.1 b(0,+)-type amino acid transporter 1-like [Actinia tenebrosa]
MSEEDPNSVIVEDQNSRVGLRRTLGIPGGIAFLVGTIIGSGIFATPRWVMMYTGSVGLNIVVWSLCGVIALFGGLCYVELGTSIPKFGGEYAYLLEIYGPFSAFLLSWIFVIFIKPSSVMILLVFGSYVVEAFFPGCSKDHNQLVKILAAAALGVITLVNCTSVKLASRMQVVFTVAKMVAILILIITGIVRIAQGHTSHFNNAFEGSTSSLGLMGFAFYNGLFAYDGWSQLNYIVEEIKNPNKNLSVCISLGIPMVTICYVLVNIGYLTVLSPAELMTSNAVAVTLAQRLYGVMAWVIPILVACSTFGTANGNAFAGGRLVFAAAREGHLPKFLAMVHTKRHTPLPALLFNSILSLIVLIPDSTTFELLLNYFTFLAWFYYLMCFAGILWLRFRRKNMKRPYKVWIGIPCIMVLVSIYLVVAPFYQAPLESLYCLLMVFSGTPFYFIFVYYKIAPKWFFQRYERVTVWLQKIFDVALPTDDEMEKEC